LEQVRDFDVATAVGDQLFIVGDVDAEPVRETDGRRSRRKPDPLRPRLLRQFDQGMGRGAAHDRVVHNEYVFIFKLALDGAELHFHRFTTTRVSASASDSTCANCTRTSSGAIAHDKRPGNVPVFHKGFAIRDLENLGYFDRIGSRGFGDRDHDIDVELGGRQNIFANSMGQVDPHLLTGLVDRDPVNDRVRPREIDIFEQTRTTTRHLGYNVRIELLVFVDHNTLPWTYVAFELIGRAHECRGLGGEHIPRRVFGET